MKLSRKQLRGLINEAIQGREIGQPLFTAPAAKRSSIKEVEDPYGGQTMYIDDVVAAASGAAQTYFASMYDPSDPSIEAAGGEESFNRQVDSALMEFEEETEQLVKRIENKLIQGEYYQGNNRGL